MERLGCTGIEIHLQTRFLLKLLDAFPVEVAPRFKLLGILLCFVYFMANRNFLSFQLFYTVEQRAFLAFAPFLEGIGSVRYFFFPRAKRDVEVVESMLITQPFVERFLQSRTRLPLFELLHMHNSLLAKPFDKAVVLFLSHQEGELFHFLNHAISSFLFA